MANRLASSTSPYLQQHADNPVDWHVWGDEALEEARRRDVPLFISVGYAACHWCHVMAHESFEDDEVARLVNEVSVPVKVDREERPDVDAVYMEATQAMTGQGGWPMSVFATPEGVPFFAGTYFPREHFVRLVEAVGEAWRERREDVVAQGNAVVEACAAAGPPLAEVTVACPIGGPCPPVSPVGEDVLDAAAAAIVRAHDGRNGGFGGAPKFPTQPALGFLLEHCGRTGERDGLDVVRRSAEAMARGGIYDQLGGGFARYSVDATWTVPHFEKMLYDNALLLDTYSVLDTVVPNVLWRRVCDETVGFLTRELRTAEGGFASALDADTEGVEGATYVWTPTQLREVLGDGDGEWARGVFAVSDAGTFEHGTSVLRLPEEPQDMEWFADVRRRLLAARDERPQPQRDDKVVAAWNGLAILGLCGYAKRRGLGGAGVARGEVAAGRLLADVHVVDGRLRRVSRDGVAGEAAGV
ncbi:MAG TPA: thioredoxin domain-containing protein, partial [Stackebrandtia sp.]|uniref:thioredoxin domain-containing protein n=1 Tax=Stackebrandtia sp. TaxID=2023065 RepID=UPI002D28C8AB